jgi:transcriptional/translational regulatory protein YebC/TACO1
VFAPGTSEDKVMEVALEAGAEDVITDDDGAIEVLTRRPTSRREERARAAGPEARRGRSDDARREHHRADGDDAQRMQKLLDVIEDLDDVQDVYHNAEMRRA